MSHGIGCLVFRMSADFLPIYGFNTTKSQKIQCGSRMVRHEANYSTFYNDVDYFPLLFLLGGALAV